MASSSSDNRFVMGYPSFSLNNNNNNNNISNKYSQAPTPQPLPGYALSSQSGVYPPPPQLPYHGYPGGTFESKKYGAPSFNAWYDSRRYLPTGWTGYTEEDSSKRFNRVMLVTMATLIISMCIVSIGIWLLFGIEMAEFDVGSLKVINLNASDSMITAKWDVNLTVFNPNTDVKVNFTHVRASIFYKNYPLALSSLEPLYLEGAQNHNFQFRLDDGKALSKPLITQELNEDQSGGILSLSVRMRLNAKFQSDSVWRKETLRVFCEDLKIIFVPSGGGNGTLAQDSQTECLIFT